MALGFGANARLIGAYETNYGSPPTEHYHQLGFSRYGLSARQQLIDNDLLGEGRDPAPAVLGALTCDGEIHVPCDARQIGFWLKALLGDPVTTGATNFTHTFQSGASTLPSLSLQAINPDIPLRRTHFGARIDSFTLPLRRDGLTSATLSVIAQGESNDTTDRDISPVTYTPMRFGSFQGTIRRDGVALGRVVSAEIIYRNGLDRIETIRPDGLIDSVEPTVASCTGNVVVRMDGTTLINAAIAGTPMELEFGYVRDINTSLLFSVHQAVLSRPSVPIEGPSGIQVTFEFRGSKDPVSGRMLTAVLKNTIATYGATE